MASLSRIHKEYQDILRSDTSQHFTVHYNPEVPLEWRVMFVGPVNTPYEGGKFEATVVFTKKYPNSPPVVTFITPIYHTNIHYETGVPCVDILKAKYKVEFSMEFILLAIQLFIGEPDSTHGLPIDRYQEYLNNRPLFFKNAREWTKKYAMGHLSPEEIKTIQQKILPLPNTTPCLPPKSHKMLTTANVKAPYLKPGEATKIILPRIRNELTKFNNKKRNDVFVKQSADQFKWKVTLKGPKETSYDGREFVIIITFPTDFPFIGPSIKFESEIRHPNIAISGDLPIVTLFENWTAGITMNMLFDRLIDILRTPSMKRIHVLRLDVLLEYHAELLKEREKDNTSKGHEKPDSNDEAVEAPPAKKKK